jgi:hypothetical protein
MERERPWYVPATRRCANASASWMAMANMLARKSKSLKQFSLFARQRHMSNPKMLLYHCSNACHGTYPGCMPRSYYRPRASKLSNPRRMRCSHTILPPRFSPSVFATNYKHKQHQPLRALYVAGRRQHRTYQQTNSTRMIEKTSQQMESLRALWLIACRFWDSSTLLLSTPTSGAHMIGFNSSRTCGLRYQKSSSLPSRLLCRLCVMRARISTG